MLYEPSLPPSLFPPPSSAPGVSATQSAVLLGVHTSVLSAPTPLRRDGPLLQLTREEQERLTQAVLSVFSPALRGRLHPAASLSQASLVEGDSFVIPPDVTITAPADVTGTVEVSPTDAVTGRVDDDRSGDGSQRTPHASPIAVDTAGSPSRPTVAVSPLRRRGGGAQVAEDGSALMSPVSGREDALITTVTWKSPTRRGNAARAVVDTGRGRRHVRQPRRSGRHSGRSDVQYVSRDGSVQSPGEEAGREGDVAGRRDSHATASTLVSEEGDSVVVDGGGGDGAAPGGDDDGHAGDDKRRRRAKRAVAAQRRHGAGGRARVGADTAAAAQAASSRRLLAEQQQRPVLGLSITQVRGRGLLGCDRGVACREHHGIATGLRCTGSQCAD